MTSVDGWSTPDPGSPADAAQHRVLARPGGGRRGWVDAVRGRVRNRIVPGFEPHGYGAETAGNYRSALFVERVLADGHADVVGMARAYIAEPAILTKARAGQARQIRPCVGGNDCISQYMEGLPFGCAVR
jgi:hypothetical protein